MRIVVQRTTVEILSLLFFLYYQPSNLATYVSSVIPLYHVAKRFKGARKWLTAACDKVAITVLVSLVVRYL